MYTFTNQFSGTTLRQRVKMMNSHRSGVLASWRYASWAVLVCMMALACRHRSKPDDFAKNLSVNPHTLAPTNASRAKVLLLEDDGTWYKQLALYQTSLGTESILSEPVVLQLKNNHFQLVDDYKYSAAVYVNGKAVSVEFLQKIPPEMVNEFFVMHQWDNLPNTDAKAKPYQLFIDISPQPIPTTSRRKRFFDFLEASALSQHPLGESYSFTMNQLLEATFFHNKNALVERTKDEHLKLYDEYANTVKVSINNLPATPAEVKTIHVREVARLYTKELPYGKWFRPGKPSPRFELHILTSPKRAKRDSTYYVFSPFYTGDF